MTTGTGVNDGQGHSLPDGAGVAPDVSKAEATAMALPAPVPASTDVPPDVLQRQKLDAFIGAVRLLGSEVRRLRAELEER